MKIKGSATVEAVFITPAILLFFSCFIWMIDLFMIHSQIGTVLTDAGKSMSEYSYAYLTLLDGSEENAELITLAASVGWSQTYLRQRIMAIGAAQKITDLSLLESSINKDGAISLKASYRVKPYMNIPGYRGINLVNSFYCKTYSGFDIPKKASGESVYVTKNSEVYHTDKNCRSLVRNVKTVRYSSLSEKRNDAGGKYYPCKLCGSKKESQTVYVTSHGNRYHTDEDCSEINVTIYTIPIEEIGERRKCYFCQ